MKIELIPNGFGDGRYVILLNDDGTRFKGLKLYTEGIISHISGMQKFIIGYTDDIDHKVYKQLLQLDEKMKTAAEECGLEYNPMLKTSIRSQFFGGKKFLRMSNTYDCAYEGQTTVHGDCVIEVGELYACGKSVYLNVEVYVKNLVSYSSSPSFSFVKDVLHLTPKN